jgi:hypothetical protein
MGFAGSCWGGEAMKDLLLVAGLAAAACIASRPPRISIASRRQLARFERQLILLAEANRADGYSVVTSLCDVDQRLDRRAIARHYEALACQVGRERLQDGHDIHQTSHTTDRLGLTIGERRHV